MNRAEGAAYNITTVQVCKTFDYLSTLIKILLDPGLDSLQL
jgi:hypothetical protein